MEDGDYVLMDWRDDYCPPTSQLVGSDELSSERDSIEWHVRSKNSLIDYVRFKVSNVLTQELDSIRALFVDDLSDELTKQPHCIQCDESLIMDIVSACVYALKKSFNITDDVMTDEDRVLMFVLAKWNLFRIYDFAIHFDPSNVSVKWGFSSAEKVFESYECPSCFYTTDECVRLIGCGHVFCASCWERQAVEMVVERGQLEVTCLAKNCPYRLPYKVIKTFPAWDKKLSNRIIPLVKASLLSSPFFKYCPGCEDKGWNTIAMAHSCLDNDGLPEVVCVKCQCSWCFTCRKQAHAPMPCAINDQWIEILHNSTVHVKTITSFVQAMRTKRCPGCGHAVQKNGGCDHIFCSCNMHWCWKCGKKPKDGVGIYTHLTNCNGLSIKTLSSSVRSGKTYTIDYCVFNYMIQLKYMQSESRISSDMIDPGLTAIQGFLFSLRKVLMNSYAFEAIMFGISDRPDFMIPTEQLFLKQKFISARTEIDNIAVAICDTIFVTGDILWELTVASIEPEIYDNMVNLMKYAFRHYDNLWDAAKSIISLIRLPMVLNESEILDNDVPILERVPKMQTFVEMMLQKKHKFQQFYNYMVTGERHLSTPVVGVEKGEGGVLDAEKEEEGEVLTIDEKWIDSIVMGEDMNDEDKIATLMTLGITRDIDIVCDVLFRNRGDLDCSAQQLIDLSLYHQRSGDDDVDDDDVSLCEKLDFLDGMGYTNLWRNKRLLKSTAGNVNMVLDILSDMASKKSKNVSNTIMSEIRIDKRRLVKQDRHDDDDARRNRFDFVDFGCIAVDTVVAFVLRKQKLRDDNGVEGGEVRAGMFQSDIDCRKMDYAYGLSIEGKVDMGLSELTWLGYSDRDSLSGMGLVDLLFDHGGCVHSVVKFLKDESRIVLSEEEEEEEAAGKNYQ